MADQIQSDILRIFAPLSGVIVPLHEVPDPTFAERLVGDGISIDPTSNVMLAPVSGTIVQLNAARHAVIIRTENKLDVMVHIGLDTVNLKGAGFEACRALGDKVQAGDELIRFDIDSIACNARSLLTQIVVMSDAVVRQISFAPTAENGRVLVQAGVDHILTVEAPVQALAGGQNNEADRADLVAAHLVIPNPSGMHARPSAVLAARARQFSSDIRMKQSSEGKQEQIAGGGRQPVNLKSASAIMQLGLAYGDAVSIFASGSDARAAVDVLAELLRNGCGDDLSMPPPKIEAPRNPPRSAAASLAAPALSGSAAEPVAYGTQLSGQPAAPGKAVGAIFQFRASKPRIVEKGGDPRHELNRLEIALREAGDRLRQMADADGTASEIFSAHRELMEDPELLHAARRLIGAGKSAEFAWNHVCRATAAALARLENQLLAGRAYDLEDIAERVVRHLSGSSLAIPVIPAGSILVTDNLTPSQTVMLDVNALAGCCLSEGGATSHAAILARSRNLPMICAMDAGIFQLEDGRSAIIDADGGVLQLDPDADARNRIEAGQKVLQQEQADALAQAGEPAVTQDGRRIEVAANVAGLDDTEQGIACGADGVGLLRSEFLYLDRSDAPSLDEQAAAYTAMAKALGPQRPLVIRTLDVGGDKPLAYLRQPAEENPFLGLRGIRLCLDQPQLLATQLQAILLAAGEGNAPLHIMFPMISSLEELRQARAILETERRAINPAPEVKIGIMIEVPSAVLLADKFAEEVDFFSIGTNDLTQYVLAMDRGNPKLSSQIDALHPAVLRMIAMTVQAAHARGKWVGLCGNLASDVEALPLLIGLELDELSASVPVIPSLKKQIRALSYGACRQLAQQALNAATVADVRALLRSK
ncbi:phosphoenolpyruvate--protein phosphotransferase [Herbaspirillum lusitanum]|uniref:phosphoenolpyruvate--protein phosphotransferase n=1 Tax=Herbaspirillum lusitanum TaxID=213312 RepID=A0ABW9AFE8_9BURK